MLSRHFLRSKVLQVVYAARLDPVDLAVSENNFKHNIQRLNDLGTLQVSALVHFAEVAGTMIDEAQHKFLPTEEELNPNRRFPNNEFIQRLSENYDYRHHCKDSNVNWGGVDYDETFRQAFIGLTKQQEYKDYLESEQSFESDHDFAIKVFRYLMNYEHLCDQIYSQSLLWEDDYDQIAQYNFMMLKAMNESFDISTMIPLMYDDRIEKDVDDYQFARQLLLVTLRHSKEVEGMIRSHLKGWEYERVASMDVLLLNMAVAELTEFPSIPERVTVDESIELSKEFSTDRSRLFINGILDKFIIELRSAGRINKSGRGLMDPTMTDTEEQE